MKLVSLTTTLIGATHDYLFALHVHTYFINVVLVYQQSYTNNLSCYFILIAVGTVEINEL